jgi:hypothetical protein
VRSKKLLRAFTALTQAGVCKDLVIQLNDSGKTFEEIADYLDNIISEKYHDNNYMTYGYGWQVRMSGQFAYNFKMPGNRSCQIYTILAII